MNSKYKNAEIIVGKINNHLFVKSELNFPLPPQRGNQFMSLH